MTGTRCDVFGPQFWSQVYSKHSFLSTKFVLTGKVYWSFETFDLYFLQNIDLQSNVIERIVFDENLHILHNGHHGSTSFNMFLLWHKVTDQSLKHTLEFGIGIHHAGLPERDRKAMCRCFRWLVDVNPWELAPWEPGPGGGRTLCGSEDYGSFDQKQCQCNRIKSMADTDDWLRIITDGLSMMKSDKKWWEVIQLMQMFESQLM